ncbi:Amidohydrolase family, partial [Striga hermonthica]
PFADEPSNHGLQLTDTRMLYNMTLSSDKARLQVAIHAIGDRSIDLVLDLYKSVASKNGMRDRRFRIEHAQHLAPGTAARFGEQEVIASVQPDLLLDDANSAPKKLGAERAHGGSYLFQKTTMKDHTYFATQWSGYEFGNSLQVADINLLGSIKTAMKRVPPGWEDDWIPSERIILKDALNG